MGHWRLGRLVVMPLPIRPFLLILLINATRITQARRSADAIAHRQALGFIEIKTMCLKTLSGGAILRWSCLAASATMHDGHLVTLAFSYRRPVCNKIIGLRRAAWDEHP